MANSPHGAPRVATEDDRDQQPSEQGEPHQATAGSHGTLGALVGEVVAEQRGIE